MNRQRRLILLVVVASFVSLACLCLPGSMLEFLFNTPGPGPVPRQEPASLPAGTCAEQLADMLSDAEETDAHGINLAVEYTLITYAVDGDSITVYDEPQVPGNLDSYQQDTARHQELWDFITTVVPPEYRRQVAYFVITTDGPAGTLGAVEQTDDPETWSLYMDVQDAGNFSDLVTTLVHEIAHIFTLDTSQVATDWDVFNNPDDYDAYERGDDACDTYFMFEGCSYPDSYINLFFARYWQEIYPEWLEISQEEDEESLENLLYDLYGRYPDQFVSDYAVTSPEEDIAESFMYFVLAPAPSGETMAEEKILFFYEFPELVTLRDDMRAGLCSTLEP
jgi:hypothetical protein